MKLTRIIWAMFGCTFLFSLLSFFLFLQNIIKVEKCAISIGNPTDLTAPSKDFSFDSAYDSKTSTESIYNDICYALVEVIPRPEKKTN